MLYNDRYVKSAPRLRMTDLEQAIASFGHHPERSRRITGRASRKPASSFDFAQDEAEDVWVFLSAMTPRSDVSSASFNRPTKAPTKDCLGTASSASCEIRTGRLLTTRDRSGIELQRHPIVQHRRGACSRPLGPYLDVRSGRPR